MSLTTDSMPRASITLMPFADTLMVMFRRSDGTKYVFFCTFGSKRRFVRRCECEMLCPKPGTAPVTWHTAAIGFLQYRGADAPPKVSCLLTLPMRTLTISRGFRRGLSRSGQWKCPAKEPAYQKRAGGPNRADASLLTTPRLRR